MKRPIALALIVALLIASAPTASFAGPRLTSSVSGIAKDATGKPLANTTVRLRNLLSGQLAAASRTSLGGSFSFENVTSGNYIVETMNAAGRVTAASSSVDVAPGAAVAGIVVTAPAEKAAAGQAGAAAAGGAGAFFHSTAGILLLTAIGAGAVAGVYVATKDDSPSK